MFSYICVLRLTALGLERAQPGNGHAQFVGKEPYEHHGGQSAPLVHPRHPRDEVNTMTL